MQSHKKELSLMNPIFHVIEELSRNAKKQAENLHGPKDSTLKGDISNLLLMIAKLLNTLVTAFDGIFLNTLGNLNNQLRTKTDQLPKTEEKNVTSKESINDLSNNEEKNVTSKESISDLSNNEEKNVTSKESINDLSNNIEKLISVLRKQQTVLKPTHQIKGPGMR